MTAQRDSLQKRADALTAGSRNTATNAKKTLAFAKQVRDAMIAVKRTMAESRQLQASEFEKCKTGMLRELQGMGMRSDHSNSSECIQAMQSKMLLRNTRKKPIFGRGYIISWLR